MDFTIENINKNKNIGTSTTSSLILQIGKLEKLFYAFMLILHIMVYYVPTRFLRVFSYLHQLLRVALFKFNLLQYYSTYRYPLILLLQCNNICT